MHAAAPCPPHVKAQLIDWLGPIVVEYYGGSETGLVTWCDSHEWLAHPGTVGRAFGTGGVRILGPDGAELAPGEDGEVYLKPLDSWPDFTYRGDDANRARHGGPTVTSRSATSATSTSRVTSTSPTAAATW